MKSSCGLQRGVFLACALATSAIASADVTLDYLTSGSDCHGDFERMQVKGAMLRVDSNRGGHDGSFIYDGIEKLAYALDHRRHQFAQLEIDEDAMDLNADRMASIQKMMRNRTGIDPFEQARALCPGVAEAARNTRPGDPVHCAAGTEQGSALAGAAMPGGVAPGGARPVGTPAMNAENMQAMQQMMQQQMAKLTPEQRERMQRGMANAGYGAMAGTPSSAPQESDRDAGSATVAGIECSKRQHLLGDDVVREECFAPLTHLNLDAGETVRITRMARVMARWRDSMLPAGFGARRGPNLDDALVERVCFAGGAQTGRATLHIVPAAIGDAQFAVPAGYAPMTLGASDPGHKP